MRKRNRREGSGGGRKERRSCLCTWSSGALPPVHSLKALCIPTSTRREVHPSPTLFLTFHPALPSPSSSSPSTLFPVHPVVSLGVCCRRELLITVRFPSVSLPSANNLSSGAACRGIDYVWVLSCCTLVVCWMMTHSRQGLERQTCIAPLTTIFRFSWTGLGLAWSLPNIAPVPPAVFVGLVDQVDVMSRVFLATSLGSHRSSCDSEINSGHLSEILGVTFNLCVLIIVLSNGCCLTEPRQG